MLNSEQNPEECDARDDDSSTKAGQQQKLFLRKLSPDNI